MSLPPNLASRAVGAAELRALATDLTQLCLDITGLFDPTPVSDGANALVSLGRGNWLDAALSGISMIPYVGDLAKAGKFPRYLKTLENAVQMANESADAAKLLGPVMQKLDRVLDLLPDAGPFELRRIRQLVEGFLSTHHVARAAQHWPDVSKQFQFREFTRGEYKYKEAIGRLGVPGKVKRHRNTGAQRGVSGGTGDDAGHLIGDRFGPPGDARNLSAQEWQTNRFGTFKDLENGWAQKLKEGWGVQVSIQDVFHPKYGMERPFMRRAEWVEVNPQGVSRRDSLLFTNPHSVKSRDARGIAPTVSEPQFDNVIHVDFANKRVLYPR